MSSTERAIERGLREKLKQSWVQETHLQAKRRTLEGELAGRGVTGSLQKRLLLVEQKRKDSRTSSVSSTAGAHTTL